MYIDKQFKVFKFHEKKTIDHRKMIKRFYMHEHKIIIQMNKLYSSNLQTIP